MKGTLEDEAVLINLKKILLVKVQKKLLKFIMKYYYQ